MEATAVPCLLQVPRGTRRALFGSPRGRPPAGVRARTGLGYHPTGGRRALRRVWDDPELEEIRAEDLGGAYPVVRYVAPGGSVVDLMARLGEAASFEDVEATRPTVPVQRFRSPEEAARALWLEPGDPRIWQALVRRWRIHQALGRPTPRPAPGVYRYRSLEEKQRATEGGSRL